MCNDNDAWDGDETEDDELDDDGIWLTEADLEDIPPELYSTFEEGPFSKCVACKTDLVDCEYYTLQNATKGKEIVFEMAVCDKCAIKQSEEYSKESLKLIDQYLNGIMTDRLIVESCKICDKALDQFTKFSRVGLCTGYSIFVHFIICDECGDDLNKNLSKQTRDSQDDFIKKHIPGVPADLDLEPVGFF